MGNANRTSNHGTRKRRRAQTIKKSTLSNRENDSGRSDRHDRGLRDRKPTKRKIGPDASLCRQLDEQADRRTQRGGWHHNRTLWTNEVVRRYDTCVRREARGTQHEPSDPGTQRGATARAGSVGRNVVPSFTMTNNPLGFNRLQTSVQQRGRHSSRGPDRSRRPRHARPRPRAR